MLSTTVCADPVKTFKGGPLDGLLNSARPYDGQPCAADYVPPRVVILRYATSTRRFVIDMGGCPGVVLNDGTELIFGSSELAHDTPILSAAGLVAASNALYSPQDATVTGHVERCGGPAPGTCRVLRFVAISLLDARGRVAAGEHGGTIVEKTLTSFSLLAQSPGRYTLQARVDGQLLRRSIRLRAGQRLHTNLILSIR